METKKLSKLSFKDFMKDSPQGARLQSLRLPRDLSLGGTKLAKKVYKPNLNVVRNKDKPKVTINKFDNFKEKHRKYQERQKQRFVQSTGVFSEGVGDSVRQPEILVSVSVRDKAPRVKKESWAVEKELESKVLNEIIKYQDESDSDEEEKVPFKPVDWCRSKLVEDPIKNEVKKEVLESSTALPKDYADNTEKANSNISLTLWQLPDSFAFKNKAKDLKTNKLIDCKLSDLPEGKIGKICVRKSGRITVYIGDLEYELEPSEFESFVEKLVSLDVKTPQESTAAVLGNIGNRFLLNPLWNTLLH